MSTREGETTPKKSKGKKFKKTKELIRLARNDGFNQKDIAAMCRTQQSTVSKWEKGLGLAREDQLKSLLDQYGHKLRRKTFRVYWNFNTEIDERAYFKVEGRVIMDHSFMDERRSSDTGRKFKSFPTRKLVVHDQGRDNYLLIKQMRIGKVGKDEFIECSVPEAAWASEIIKPSPMSSKELIEYIDKDSNELLDRQLSDAVTLPYLIRQALLYAGVSVDEVVDYPSS